MVKNSECSGCFYEEADPRDAPCRSCWESSKYVHRDVFKDVSDSPVFKQTGKLSWEFNPADALRKTFGKEEYNDGYYGGSEEYLTKEYNKVDKPRHYMLFEDKGIEVRDVIEKLVGKLNSENTPGTVLFEADYVQMLQYVMRFMDKNGVEDLKKARWYLDKMIEPYE